jgi:5-methylcytosine-specific restriction endonuclease McrA
LADGYEHDHIMPVSKGGVNTIDNIQLLCVACNRTKRDMLPEEWTAKIGKLGL